MPILPMLCYLRKSQASHFDIYIKEQYMTKRIIENEFYTNYEKIIVSILGVQSSDI